MSDVTLNAVFGPRYEIVIRGEAEPLRINVGTGFNGLSQVNNSTLDVTVTVAETINAYRAIGYDGLFTQLTEESLSNYAGVTRMAVVVNDLVNVVRIGLIEEPTWNWTPNFPIFISSQGVLTQTLPIGFVRRIAWATSTTQINLDPFPIITGV